MREKAATRTARIERANQDRPAGLTLLEVVLSIAIFLSTLAVLSQLISTGVRAAVRSRLQTQAVLRCQAKMEEILAGAEPLAEVSEGTFEDDEEDNWRWSLSVEPTDTDNLYKLVVKVWRRTEDETDLSFVSCTLTRLYFDRQAVAQQTAESGQVLESDRTRNNSNRSQQEGQAAGAAADSNNTTTSSGARSR